MGLSYPMLPSSRLYVKRLELDWTSLLKSETGTGRLDSPDSNEIWYWQTRLRGDWISCLWPETRTGRLDSPDSDLKPGLADWGTPFLWLETKPDRLDSLTSCTPWLWPETGTLKIRLPVQTGLWSETRLRLDSLGPPDSGLKLGPAWCTGFPDSDLILDSPDSHLKLGLQSGLSMTIIDFLSLTWNWDFQIVGPDFDLK
jgi:hypothetical protein